MHPLHDAIARRLAEQIKSRRVVVWYDERGEFQPFIDELRDGRPAACSPTPVTVAGMGASLAECTGSLFELRMAIEPQVNGDSPEPVVLYLPNRARDRQGSVLMELEKAGTTWEPQLKQLARFVLLEKYTLGVVDELLPYDRKVSYADLARAASNENGTEPPSILKSIFHEAGGPDALLANWLVSDHRDADIEAKDAMAELSKLAKARLGLDLPADAPLAKLRAITARYVLAGEFRLDLACNPPASLDGIAIPTGQDSENAVRELARRLRLNHAKAYLTLADQVEAELGLRAANLPPKALGSIDTFRFEERVLLQYAGELIATGQFDAAQELVAEREHSFWLDRNMGRKAQWEAARRMAELGTQATRLKAATEAMTGDAGAWLDAYVAKNGWYRLDQAQRRLEAWVANLDEEPEERPLAMVRRAYEDACHPLTTGFSQALAKAGWAIPGTLHQTRIFSECINVSPKPVAYFLVDAMRYEMGVELTERLPATVEISVRAAVAALPSITPMGMAALMPGAAASFAVVVHGGKLGARIDGQFLADLTSRKKYAAARVPALVDLALDELLGLPVSKLSKKLAGAEVVIIRSQEIDHAGETGFTFQARQVMDTVIDNLARAIRKLAGAGIEHAVVTADHGHLFFPTDRDESMRTDAPGGDTVELHRRCWIGRGGSTPPGCMRVTAGELGYASDLDFIFPVASGVFRAGGDLAFHHGGTSLQEMVIPVVTIRSKSREAPRAKSGACPIAVSAAPEVITNRIFSVTFGFSEKQLSFDAMAISVRPLLISDGHQVGKVGMAVDAEFDNGTGCVTLMPDKPATVAFQLIDETVDTLRVVIQDPATDAELYRSPNDITVRLGL